jgi:glycosyltransferase involved in cell wall biosynthesis
MSIDTPLVGIGLPTHNGARYLGEALDSLLAQDYPNIEIVVSDNASTDGTLAIAQWYAARDHRVRVLHRDANVGAPANFRLVFEQTTGPYFMWAADDDLWEPGYVRACLRALESAPSAVLACSRIAFIGEAGQPVEMNLRLYDNPDLQSASVRQRIRQLLSRGAWYQVYGLMRRDALTRTRLFTEAFGADVVLVAELALHGPCMLVQERLFRYRLFDRRTEPDRGGWHEAIKDRPKIQTAPYTFLQEAIAEAIAVSHAPPTDRVLAWLGMVEATYLRPTRIRSWILAETRIRLRLAIRERDIRSAIKYASLVAAAPLYRVPAWARRRARLLRNA